MRKLPDRVWRLPRQEDDEAADEGIGRILALSDGVFAIALTLLILDVVVPATTSDDELGKALLNLWPRYLAYVLSFLVIARFWVVHHQTFRLIVRDDARLIYLNFLLLLFIAFLPFPTAVLGAHEGSPAAAVLYAVAVCLTSASSAAYLWYATGGAQLLRPDAGRGQIRAMRARSLSGPVFFALSVPIAAFAPYIAEAVWVFAFPLARISFVWFLGEEPGQPG
ncbi:MAG TPA: TMEM175 family protein [Streptosporangiaceae bacterium]|nr:TMEM175 family protein [Streptosporangiaceae bacterium]